MAGYGSNDLSCLEWLEMAEMAGMTRNGQNWLEICWKWQKWLKNGRKWLKKDECGCKGLKMAGTAEHVWIFLNMAVNGFKGKKSLEMAGYCWKWPEWTGKCSKLFEWL